MFVFVVLQFEAKNDNNGFLFAKKSNIFCTISMGEILPVAVLDIINI